jgi:hypothetical protein
MSMPGLLDGASWTLSFDAFFPAFAQAFSIVLLFNQ